MGQRVDVAHLPQRVPAEPVQVEELPVVLGERLPEEVEQIDAVGAGLQVQHGEGAQRLGAREPGIVIGIDRREDLTRRARHRLHPLAGGNGGRGHAAAERQHVHDLLADPGPHVDADPLAALDRPRHAHHERLVPPGRQRLHPADHAGEQRRVLPFPAELEQERMAHEVELDPVVVEAQDLFRDPDHVVPVAVHRVVERPAHPPRDRLGLVDGAGLADEPVGVLGLDGVDAPAARRDRFGIGVVRVVRVVHAQREEHLHPAVARAAGDELGRVVAGLQERLQVAPRPPVVDVQELALGGAMVLHPEGPPLPAGPREVQPVGRAAAPDVGVDVGAGQRREQLDTGSPRRTSAPRGASCGSLRAYRRPRCR